MSTGRIDETPGGSTCTAGGVGHGTTFAVAVDFSRVLEVAMQRQLEGVQLTPSRYATLVRADGQTAAAIAPLLGVSAQRVSNTVHELGLLGYLTDEPGTDRRRRVLRITEAGRAALAGAGALLVPPVLLDAMVSYLSDNQFPPATVRSLGKSPERK